MLSSVVEIYLVTNVKKPCFIIIILGSNHFGIAGWYGMRAMEQGLIVKYFLILVPVYYIALVLKMNIQIET